MLAVSQRYATEYPGEFIFTQDSVTSNNILITNDYTEEDIAITKSQIDALYPAVSVVDDVEKLKDEIQILKDEIENLKMLLLEN